MVRTMSRRVVLKGLLGGAVASVQLPILEAMLNTNGTAFASGAALPVRTLVGFWGCGAKNDRWVPTSEGANYPLSPELLPLAPVQDYMSVVTGLNIGTGDPRGHHSGTVGILSGSPLIALPLTGGPYASTFSKPSIDQVVAKAMGTSTKFASIEVGICTEVDAVEGTTLRYLSHNGPNDANPPEYSPAKLYQRLFNVPAPTGNDKSVLDAVLTDLQSLQSRVSTADKARLDQFTSNIRDTEVRMAKTSATCSSVTDPKSDFPAVNGVEPFQARADAMWSLIATAFACDLTRVVSVMYSGSVTSDVFSNVGNDAGLHYLTHTDPNDQPKVHAAITFTMGQFSRLLQVFKATADGAGNLLDNSVSFLTTDIADAYTHSNQDYPILIVGKAAGKLRYPGIHVRLIAQNTSQALLTVLRAAGLPLQSFGTDGGYVTTGISAIEM